MAARKSPDAGGVSSELELALASRTADDVELALARAFEAGLSLDMVRALIALLDAEFHQRHEDVVSALQRLKDARAVAALSRAARKTHLNPEWDESFGFARKCTWALADIGTPEARASLEMLAKNDNELIAGYAQRRLDRWDDELDRKPKPS